jgi:hypothetical protein
MCDWPTGFTLLSPITRSTQARKRAKLRVLLLQCFGRNVFVDDDDDDNDDDDI